MQGMHHDKPIEAVCVGVGWLGQVGCGWRGVMDLSSVRVEKCRYGSAHHFENLFADSCFHHMFNYVHVVSDILVLHALRHPETVA